MVFNFFFFLPKTEGRRPSASRFERLAPTLNFGDTRSVVFTFWLLVSCTMGLCLLVGCLAESQ